MKPFHFEFSPAAERAFAKFQKPLQRRLLNKLDYFEAAENPLIHAKQLKGLDHIYRFRVGEYRVLVKPNEKNLWVILVIVKIAHRREANE